MDIWQAVEVVLIRAVAALATTPACRVFGKASTLVILESRERTTSGTVSLNFTKDKRYFERKAIPSESCCSAVGLADLNS